jgi:hypothetical protein
MQRWSRGWRWPKFVTRPLADARGSAKSTSRFGATTVSTYSEPVESASNFYESQLSRDGYGTVVVACMHPVWFQLRRVREWS